MTNDGQWERRPGDGTLWLEQEAKVFSGRILGEDGIERYYTFVQKADGRGGSSLTLCQDIGLVFDNRGKKRNERGPDFTANLPGPLNERGESLPHRFAAWMKKTRTGRWLLSVRFDAAEVPAAPAPAPDAAPAHGGPHTAPISPDAAQWVLNKVDPNLVPATPLPDGHPAKADEGPDGDQWNGKVAAETTKAAPVPVEEEIPPF